VFPTGWGFASSLDADALVGGEDVFVAATGITNGSPLRRRPLQSGGAVTESLVVRPGPVPPAGSELSLNSTSSNVLLG